MKKKTKAIEVRQFFRNELCDPFGSIDFDLAMENRVGEAKKDWQGYLLPVVLDGKHYSLVFSDPTYDAAHCEYALLHEGRELSWARLQTSSPDGVRFWLMFIAKIWMHAANNSSKEDYEEVLAGIESVFTTPDKYNYPWDRDGHGGCYRLRDAFGALSERIDRLSSVNLGCNKPTPDISFGVKQDEGGSFSKLVVRWDGEMTPCRYLSVTYEPFRKTGPQLLVEWDTATGEESSFLNLPSAAMKYAESDEAARIEPLKNIFIEACKLGEIDVSDLEADSRGTEEAKRRLFKHATDLLEIAAANGAVGGRESK